MPSGQSGACEEDKQSAVRDMKSQTACTSSCIEQTQAQGQETFPRRARKVRENDRNSDAKEARQDDEQSSSIQEQINSSNQSIGKLKSHLEKGTCPKTLRYNARANIMPNEDFKND